MLLYILMLIFIGLAILLSWYLLSHDHGEKEPVAALWLAVGFGLLGGIASALIEDHLISANNLLATAPHETLLFSCMAVGAIEEAFKFLPLAFFIYKKRYFNEHTDGVIYFALAGLGFGLPENILYATQYGTKVGISRVLLTPIFHAATTGTVGYFLAKRKLAGKSPLGVVLPLIVVMLLHGLYDFGLSSGSTPLAAISLLITLGLSAGLFMVFLRANEHDQDRGLSVVGNNSFCRFCGQPNPAHHLFCIRCGKRA